MLFRVVAASAAFGIASFAASISANADSWSGIYIGAHAGYATGDVDLDLSHTTGALIYNDPFDPSQRQIDLSDGWLGGFQVGANQQMGGLVFGVEADASWTDLDGSGVFTTITGGPCTPNSCTQWTVATEIEALGTIRGRVGMTAGDAFFYGTAGLAWAMVDANQKTDHNGPAFATPGAVVSGDTQHIGYAVGGGAEVQLAEGWSLKGEYIYVDLGDASYELTGTTTPGGSTPWAESFSQSIELHSFRVGLNYQIGQF
mgnify:FL=1